MLDAIGENIRANESSSSCIVRTLGAMRPAEETRMQQALAEHVDAHDEDDDMQQLHPFYPLFMGGGMLQSVLATNMIKKQLGRRRVDFEMGSDENDTVVSCGSVTSSLMRRTPSLVASSTMLSPSEAAKKGDLTFTPVMRSMHRPQPSSCVSV